MHTTWVHHDKVYHCHVIINVVLDTNFRSKGIQLMLKVLLFKMFVLYPFRYNGEILQWKNSVQRLNLYLFIFFPWKTVTSNCPLQTKWCRRHTVKLNWTKLKEMPLSTPSRTTTGTKCTSMTCQSGVSSPGILCLTKPHEKPWDSIPRSSVSAQLVLTSFSCECICQEPVLNISALTDFLILFFLYYILLCIYCTIILIFL